MASIHPINPRREALSQAIMTLMANTFNNYLRTRYAFLPEEQQAEIVNEYRDIIADLEQQCTEIDRQETVLRQQVLEASAQ